MSKKYQHSIFFYDFISFILPIVILFFILLSRGIYWGSDTTILASDGFHQYVIFAEGLRNILHGKDSLFYTFTSGLGLNFYALMSYYLGSFLSPFYYFFNLNNMPDAIYLFTLIKVGLSGLTCFYSLDKIYTVVNKKLTLLLSTFYALMSFTTSQIEINMWIDVFIILPLILLGLHRLIKEKKLTLYYISLTIVLIQNYYFGFMICLFLALYSICLLIESSSWKIALSSLTRFIIVSLLAVVTSSIMLLPTYFDLTTQGEQLTHIDKLFTENIWYLDLFAKNFIGSYDTTKFGALPTIFIGLFPLYLFPIFFTLKNIKMRVKLAYTFVLLIIVSSFYLQPLDLLWQGFHAPNMFLHRYSWVWSVMILMLSARVLVHLKEIKVRYYIISFLILSFGFILTAICTNHYSFIEPVYVIITIAFLLAYTLLFITLSKGYLPKILFIFFICIFSLFEISLNIFYQIDGLANEWVFPTRDGYNKNLNDFTTLVAQTELDNTAFYRMEELLPQTGNDSMKFNYNGISQFSSIRNRNSSHLLDRLGFQSTGTNLNLRYQNNTLLMDSLFGVKYNLATSAIQKYGFNYETSQGDVSLYRNTYASTGAILSNGIYKDVNITVNTLDNQTNIINQLSGLNQKYFYRLPYQVTSQVSQLNNRITVNSSNNQDSEITFHLITDRAGQLYFSVPNISFINDNSKSIHIFVNDQAFNYTIDDAYSFFDLGFYEENQDVTVRMVFSDNKQVTFDTPNLYDLDSSAYQAAMEKISSQAATMTTSGNKVTVDYKSQEESSLILMLPYDKGWSATLNGQKLKIEQFQGGLMKVTVPKGQGSLVLKFIPHGFIFGTILTSLGAIGFLVVQFLTKRKRFQTD